MKGSYSIKFLHLVKDTLEFGGVKSEDPQIYSTFFLPKIFQTIWMDGWMDGKDDTSFLIALVAPTNLY